MALTKARIVEEIARRNFRAKEEAYSHTQALLEIIKRTLEAGEDVMISGFGKFAVKTKKARRGRNPATGEQMVLKPKRRVTFYCSSRLRRKLNGNGPWD